MAKSSKLELDMDKAIAMAINGRGAVMPASMLGQRGFAIFARRAGQWGVDAVGRESPRRHPDDGGRVADQGVRTAGGAVSPGCARARCRA